MPGIETSVLYVFCCNYMFLIFLFCFVFVGLLGNFKLHAWFTLSLCLWFFETRADLKLEAYTVLRVTV